MSLLAAVMLICSSGDRDVAAAVLAEAVAQGVPAELALAVSCVESGLTAHNPMGVRDCYAGRNNGRFDSQACITIGVRSLANRLRGCGGDQVCAARRFNNAAHKVAYAAKVTRIAKFLRRHK